MADDDDEKAKFFKKHFGDDEIDDDDEDDLDYEDYEGYDISGFVTSTYVDFEAEEAEEEALDDWRYVKLKIRRANMLRRVEHDEPHFMIGRYEALETVDGGMGLVVIGRDPELGRKVAIKLWKAEGLVAEVALRNEARILAKLDHPNVVGVYDVGTYRNSVYFVMASAEGTNGYKWIFERDPTWEEVRTVFLAAGSGLAAAHAAGIHHRDFKPANMLVCNDGRVLVLDFGIAGRLQPPDESGDSGPTPDLPADGERGPTGAGTRAYMAPERLRGERGDARSDQFSFCVSMWEALHCVRPYPGDASDELLEAIARGVIRTGSSTEDVPHWLSRIVRKGLAEKPTQRYQDMKELLAALREGPSGGEALDGESANADVSGGVGRLLNAPETGAHGSAAELDALVDEVAKRLQLKAGAPNSEEHLVTFAGDRFAPRQNQSRLLVFMSAVSTIGVLFTLVLVGMILRPSAPVAVETPPVVPVVEDPLNLILEYVAADEFGKADALWYDKHRKNPSSERGPALSDDDSLTIARACLSRARELTAADPETAREAAKMAGLIAAVAMDFGRDPKVKEAGRQLYLDVKDVIRQLPAHGEPTGI